MSLGIRCSKCKNAACDWTKLVIIQEPMEAYCQSCALTQIEQWEGKAHQLFDDACSNLAYGNLSKEMRDGYVKQTYKSTELHSQSMTLLRALWETIKQVDHRESDTD